uniref:Uncharacterized protein n=1 Tax=Tetradesmus obliquus TaxID=3088 RepID=A0A383VT00_TETOB|eukprot:jgi/Sobl393_1/12477/SZX68648.1
MLSAATAGVSVSAARVRCRGATTCFAKQQGVTALRPRLPRSYTASTTASCRPTGFHTPKRQAWSCSHQLRAASSGAASDSVYQLPSFTFEECAREVLLCAAPSTTEQQRSAAIARLAACKEFVGESWWMLVECGVWAPGAPPPAGQAGTPARAVLCFSPGRNVGQRDFAAKAFALDSSGLPTGEMYVDYRGNPSVSAFEQRTSRKPAKKYRISCVIIRDGQPAMATPHAMLRVEHFLVEYFGEHSMHRRHKVKAAAAAGAAAAVAALAGSTSGGAAPTDTSGAPPAGSSRRRRRQQ